MLYDHALWLLHQLTASNGENMSPVIQVVELKKLCKQERITGYSKLKKGQLITRLQEQLQIDRG